MADFQISDYILQRECEALAREIVDNLDGPLAEHMDDAMEAAHEYADGHEYVIYHHKALMLCAHCDTDYGEAFLEGIGMPEGPTFYGLASLIAYGEVRARIEGALQEMAEADEGSDT